jgi:hypothetical protein
MTEVIQTIHQSDSLKISGLVRETGDWCILTFIGVGSGFADHQESQLEEFKRLDPTWGTQLFIFDRHRTWGNGLDFDELMEATAPYRLGKRILVLGASMGGYLAILTSQLTKPEVCMTFAPQFSVHPEIIPTEHRWNHYTLRIKEWKNRSLEGAFNPDTWFFNFFPGEEREMEHLMRFPRSASVHNVLVPGTEHNVARTLNEAGLLYPILHTARTLRSVSQLPLETQTIDELSFVNLSASIKNLPRNL